MEKCQLVSKFYKWVSKTLLVFLIRLLIINTIFYFVSLTDPCNEFHYLGQGTRTRASSFLSYYYYDC